jgi:hypothetical protein
MPDLAFDGDLRALVDAARGVWTRRLIDYSRANSLLFFRDLKVGTLDLTAKPEAIDRLLAGDALSAKAMGVHREGSRDPIARERGEAQAEQQATAALLALQRKALSNLEEKGIETLHLAMGLATWPASDGGRPYDAPVLLVPARIEVRGRTGDELRVVVTGEGQINPVLLHVLEEHHAVRIDGPALLADCSGDDDGDERRLIDREGVLARVEIAAKTLPGVAIRRRVILANFQFAKMAMVEDLKKHGDAIAASPIVAAVSGHAPSRQKLAQAVVDISPPQLDERPPETDFLVLDADSAQHRAIALVGQGQNGVVQGPPGTGKSQTIANVIAQSVAEGRRVLFVAEKRAALDAVVKRLSHGDVDLAHLVLDLHGASISRKEVMARLARALEEIRHAAPAEGAEAVHREFEARRRQLNEHARRVNAPRAPTGQSVNRLIGRLLGLPPAARSEVRLRGDVLVAITAERADEIARWLVEGAANADLLLGTSTSPWNDARITDGTQAQNAIDLA